MCQIIKLKSSLLTFLKISEKRNNFYFHVHRGVIKFRFFKVKMYSEVERDKNNLIATGKFQISLKNFRKKKGEKNETRYNDLKDVEVHFHFS